MSFFSFNEMCKSQTAKELGIDNKPKDPVTKANIRGTIAALEEIRGLWLAFCFSNDISPDPRIRVNSGYRCPELNRAVGGSETSAHLIGMAADIVPVNGRMDDFARTVLEWASTADFDQIILEQCDGDGTPAWIHIGLENQKGERRRQVFRT